MIQTKMKFGPAKAGFALLVAYALIAISACDDGGDSSAGHSIYIFINDTGSRIDVERNGGEVWKGVDRFSLDDHGDEYAVTLEEEGKIKYSWTYYGSGQIDIVTSDNEILFRNK